MLRISEFFEEPDRRAHERFFTRTASPGQGFATDMPVVCERFRVLYSD